MKFDAHLTLLDRQVLDADDAPVAIVDDIEISDLPTGAIPVGHPAPEIVNIVTGPVLLTRIFGGRPPDSRLLRIRWRLVSELGTALHLNAYAESLEVGWSERWVRDHVIARIPGGRHDPQ